MEPSPCKSCLVFPCCSKICKDKISYTSEMVIRLAHFYGVNVFESHKNKNINKYVKDLLYENSQITKRILDSDDRDDFTSEITTNFHIIREMIEKEIETDGSEKNKTFCYKVMKSYDGKK